MKLITEFSHDLIYTFKYHNNGLEKQASTITINAPNNRVLAHISIIDSEVSKALFNLAKMQDTFRKDNASSTTSNFEDNATSSEQLIMLLAGNGADIVKCYDSLRNILLEGNKQNPMATIDNIEKVTQPIFDSINPKDTKIILGRYIINFLSFFQQN